MSLAIRVGAIGLLFTQAVLTARLLGPAGYGKFAVVLSVASLLASLSLLGLNGFAVREVSRLRVLANHGALRGFVRWAACIVVCASGIGGAAMAALAVVATGTVQPEFAWGVAIVPLMTLLLLLRGISQGAGAVFHAQAPTDLVRPATMVVALGAAMVAAVPITVDGTLGLLVAANLLAMVLAGSALRRFVAAEIPAAPTVQSGADWIRGAAPFFGTYVLATFHTEINTLLLGWLAGPEETGLFQPLLRIVPIMVIAVQAVTVPLAPRISEFWERGETQRLKRMISLATISTTAAVMVTSAALLVLAPSIFAVFGAAFSVNFPALLWLAGAQVVNVACGPVSSLLDMTNFQRFSMWSLVVSVAANFLTGVWLIPHHGALGAAIAMAVGIVAVNLSMLVCVWRKLEFDPSLVGAIRYRLSGNSRPDVSR